MLKVLKVRLPHRGLARSALALAARVWPLLAVARQTISTRLLNNRSRTRQRNVRIAVMLAGSMLAVMLWLWRGRRRWSSSEACVCARWDNRCESSQPLAGRLFLGRARPGVRIASHAAGCCRRCPNWCPCCSCYCVWRVNWRGRVPPALHEWGALS